MTTATTSAGEWAEQVIKQEEIDRYLIDGKDFIDENKINHTLSVNNQPSKQQVRDILAKSLDIQRLDPEETALLLNVQDNDLWEEMYETGLKVKRKVYDNRIVFFAPLYCSNYCVNSCAYCGFRKENPDEKRRRLSMEEVRRETEVMVSEGHKRMMIVYGEHPLSDVDYMCDTIKNVYEVKAPAPRGPGYGQIRRTNVNAAPMSISDLKKLWKAGIGTYQVFQETYHKPTYASLHPANTIKGNYQWRLYALHRAMEAGIDDVAIGALFGLYDWRFEVMGLLYHTIDLENRFDIGPHTISFPRMTPASGSAISGESSYIVNDDEFKKLVTVLRLAVPYTGLICTAREAPGIKKEVIKVGCTQTDASTQLGIGGYCDVLKNLQERDIFQDSITQDKDTQQFTLGETRRLDSVIRECADMGMISSFCTAGYRCGRTGDKIMGLLKGCIEGKFCKLNAVLTFREYLDDYASEATKSIGEKIIAKELAEIEKEPFFQKGPTYSNFTKMLHRIESGERDAYI